MKTRLLLLLAVFMTALSVNAQITSVALVGPASDGCWPGEPCDTFETDPTQLIQIDADNWSISGKTLAPGLCKIRANNFWGGAGFEWAGAYPSAVGTSAGDIIIPTGGVYNITLNTATNVFMFEVAASFPVVKIVGTAVTGGTITMVANTATSYSLPLTTFLTGTAQFEISGELIGGSSFPGGELAPPSSLINVIGGSYTSVNLNVGGGTYEFVAAPLTQDVTLIGEAVGSWSVDTPIFSSAGSDNYFLNDLTTLAGQCKFRVNAATQAWNGSFGGAAFPSGTAVVGNDNITGVLPGNYDVKVNLATKIFSFLNTPISIIGSSVGGWNDSNDIYFTTTDGVNYTLNNQLMSAGECKFRRYGAWAGSLGGATFGATGTSTPSNNNITGVIAGTYNITFNKLNGAFTFTPSLATTSFATAGFKVYPNPSNNVWNFTSAKEAIVSVQIIDMLGKVVVTSNNTTVDASTLNTGVYFAKVTTATGTASVKVVKN